MLRSQVSGGDRDQHCLLPHEQFPGTVKHQFALFFFTLDQNKPHRRTLNRFTDRFRIRCVVLLSFDLGLHISGGHRLYIVAHIYKRPRSIVSGSTRLKSDQTDRQSFEKLANLAAPKLPSDNHFTCLINPVNLEYALRHINSYCANFLNGRSPVCGFQQPYYGITDAGGGDRPLNQSHGLSSH